MIMTSKRHLLSSALRVAALQYEADARACTTAQDGVGAVPRDRLVQAFKSQAAEVSRLADEIEQADVIRLED